MENPDHYFPTIGKIAGRFSNHWKLILLPFFLFLSGEAQAFTCTTRYDSIEFSIGEWTSFDHEPQPGELYWAYTADLVPGDVVILDVTAPGNTNPTNTDCALFVRYIEAGYRTCQWNANESFDCDGAMVYFPRKDLTYLPVNYGCEVFFCPPDGHNGQSAHINARIRPAQAIGYSPGFLPDLLGDPDQTFSATVPPSGGGPQSGGPAPGDPDTGGPGPDGLGPGEPQPPAPKPPDGPNACSPMGLPGFRVNTANLNLFLQDRDFVYTSVGPDMDFARSYNTRPYAAGMFGRGWTLTYEQRMAGYREYAIHEDGDGAKRRYAVPDIYLVAGGGYHPLWDGVYVSGEGDRRRLTVHNLTNGLPVYFTLWNPDTHLTGIFTTTVTAAQMGDASATAEGALRWLRDQNSNEVAITWNANGRMTKVRDAAGRETAFTYNASNLCTQMTAPDGRFARYSYNLSINAMTQSLDFAGNRTVYHYAPANTNAQAWLSSYVITNMNAAGHNWGFTHDIFGTLAMVVDPNLTSIGYWMPGPDIENRGVSRVDPKRGSTHYNSIAGRTYQVLDPMGNETFIYYSNSLPVRRIDPWGQSRYMVYDTNGNLVRLTREDGTVRTAGHDGSGRLTAITNALGGVRRFQYDARGNATNVISPAGRSVAMDYDSFGRLTRMRHPGNRVYEYRRDAFGNVTNIVDPAGHTWTFLYDAQGLRLAMVVDPAGSATTVSYDDNDRLTSVVHEDGTERETRYDCCAWSALVDERGYTNHVERNAWQMITRATDPLGRHVDMTYDDRNNLIRIAYPDGTSDGFGYDVIDRLVSVTNRNGTMVSLTNDALGRLTTLVNEREGLYQFEHDQVGRMTYIQYPNCWEWAMHPTPYRSSVVSYQYDGLGRLTRETTRGNPYAYHERVVSLAYDADGLVTAKYHNGSLAASYTYDAAVGLSEMTDTLGTTRWQRDAMLRVTNIIYPDGFTAACGYDGIGSVTSISYPGGPVLSYAYDTRHSVTSMTWDGQSIEFQLDAAGNVTNEIRSNGTDTLREYDAAAQVTRLRHRRGAAALIQLRYQRDAMGRTTNTIKEGGVLAVTPVFAPATNRAQYDLGDELTNWNGAAVQCDWRGGMTTNFPSRFTAVYDTEARAINMNLNGTNAIHAYDGLGRRVRSTLNGRTKTFHHDVGGRLLFETEGGKITARYFWRGAALVAMWREDKGYFFYHHDRMGNTLALTDWNGMPAAIYRYTPYGQVASGFTRVENPFTYAGRYGVMDEGGGIFFMKNRYYDAVAGRFLTRDPTGLDGGPNMFGYVGGNPIDGVDPNGEFGIVETLVVGGIIAAGVWQVIGPRVQSWQQRAQAVAQQNVNNNLRADNFIYNQANNEHNRELARLGGEIVPEAAQMEADIYRQALDARETINKPIQEVLQDQVTPTPNDLWEWTPNPDSPPQCDPASTTVTLP